MKFLTYVLLLACYFLLNTAQASPWDDLKPYEVTKNTPIIFSPYDNTLVLEDPTGKLTVEEVLARKDEFGKPVLLLAHIDVVDARREDWERDPFKLIEEDGYFYGRGTSDMKALAAIWVDMLERFRAEGYKPKRTIKLALTCGEETSWAFNGARWLTENKRDLIDAEFVLNEGGGGRTDGKGTVVAQNFHVGEKTVGNYRIEATNPGGHSSIPIRDNAIYELSDALVKLREFEFPVMLTDTTRAFFSRLGAKRNDEVGKAMLAVVANPQDKAAVAVLDKDRTFHSMLRTTCVATMLRGGHALNALPQAATVSVNCRIMPGVSIETIKSTLQTVIANPAATITVLGLPAASDASPLRPDVMGAIRTAIDRRAPGLPIVPQMSAGATDSLYFRAAGIPSYGLSGMFMNPADDFAHGLNERAPVAAIDGALDQWHTVISILAK